MSKNYQSPEMAIISAGLSNSMAVDFAYSSSNKPLRTLELAKSFNLSLPTLENIANQNL
jgi:hypothetical protein